MIYSPLIKFNLFAFNILRRFEKLDLHKKDCNFPFWFWFFNLVFQATESSVAFPSATHKLDPFT